MKARAQRVDGGPWYRPGRRAARVSARASAWCALVPVMLLANVARAVEPAVAPDSPPLTSPAIVEDGPDLASLQRAALARAGLDPERLQGMERRLRASALLPQVRVRVGRGTGQLQTLTDYDGTARLSVGDRDAWQFDVSASWSLDRLVFHPDELRLAREVDRLAAHRERLLRQVAELYAERQRLRLALVRARARSAEAADIALRLAAVSATLDSLTVGARSRPE